MVGSQGNRKKIGHNECTGVSLCEILLRKEAEKERSRWNEN